MSAIKNRVKAFATHLMDLAMESDDPQQALAIGNCVAILLQPYQQQEQQSTAKKASRNRRHRDAKKQRGKQEEALQQREAVSPEILDTRREVEELRRQIEQQSVVLPITVPQHEESVTMDQLETQAARRPRSVRDELGYPPKGTLTRLPDGSFAIV